MSWNDMHNDQGCRDKEAAANEKRCDEVAMETFLSFPFRFTLFYFIFPRNLWKYRELASSLAVSVSLQPKIAFSNTAQFDYKFTIAVTDNSLNPESNIYALLWIVIRIPIRQLRTQILCGLPCWLRPNAIPAFIFHSCNCPCSNLPASNAAAIFFLQTVTPSIQPVITASQPYRRAIPAIPLAIIISAGVPVISRSARSSLISAAVLRPSFTISLSCATRPGFDLGAAALGAGFFAGSFSPLCGGWKQHCLN